MYSHLLPVRHNEPVDKTLSRKAAPNPCYAVPLGEGDGELERPPMIATEAGRGSHQLACPVDSPFPRSLTSVGSAFGRNLRGPLVTNSNLLFFRCPLPSHIHAKAILGSTRGQFQC